MGNLRIFRTIALNVDLTLLPLHNRNAHELVITLTWAFLEWYHTKVGTQSYNHDVLAWTLPASDTRSRASKPLSTLYV